MRRFVSKAFLLKKARAGSSDSEGSRIPTIVSGWVTMIFVTKNGKITAVIEHIEDSGIEDFLLERDARFRRMLDRTKREKGCMSLKQYRKARGI
ncbi:unnamed protein product [marine sediment metagenome]|uniref:Uncharacterized protein n=1 Tax=marine sediment metagenome TaxID=412755 RepID=X1I4R8_9ZZZZ